MTAQEYREQFVEKKTKNASEKVRYTNSQSRKRGEGAEELIISACEYYKKMGIALIEKTPEPMKVIKSLQNGEFISVFTKKSQPDFKGVLKGGQCVHFECKSTQNDRILKKAVTPEQTEALEKSFVLGAECFVVVYFYMVNKAFKFPWNVWNNMETIFKHKYISIDDAKSYEVNVGYYGIDFLKTN